jgi:hypothetical protein
MARLNGYLYQIRAVEKSECVCGQTRETVEHFLLNCKEWEAQREQLYQQLKKRNNTLSYLLGGKSLQDDKDWKPDMEAIHTTIKFVLATGRLDKQATIEDTQTNNWRRRATPATPVTPARPTTD